MKANLLRWLPLLLVLGAVFKLPAQQSEADRKLLADICANAEKGGAHAQNKLGAYWSLANSAWQRIMWKR